MATVLIIYYKQISEGFEDRNRYQIMQKVGMSRREVKNRQQSDQDGIFPAAWTFGSPSGSGIPVDSKTSFVI